MLSTNYMFTNHIICIKRIWHLNNLERLICHKTLPNPSQTDMISKCFTLLLFGDTYGIMVQLLNKAICISHSSKTFEKGMNPIILRAAMGKIVEKTRQFSPSMATSLGERKLWIQISFTRIKNWLYVISWLSWKGWVSTRVGFIPLKNWPCVG